MDVNEKLIENRAGAGSCKARGAPVSPLVIDADQLFQGRSEVALRHGDAVYHLKITRLGKLILNK